MVIVHLDGWYFENLTDVIKITIHHDENIFFHFHVYYRRITSKISHWKKVSARSSRKYLPKSIVAKFILVRCTFFDVFMKPGN